MTIMAWFVVVHGIEVRAGLLVEWDALELHDLAAPAVVLPLEDFVQKRFELRLRK